MADFPVAEVEAREKDPATDSSKTSGSMAFALASS